MMREDEVGRASCQLTANAIAQNSITHIGYGYAALWVERTLLLLFLNRLGTEQDIRISGSDFRNIQK